MKTLGDDPKDVAYNGYTALMKGEHRAYGSIRVKLLCGTGNVLPNEVITRLTHGLMAKNNS